MGGMVRSTLTSTPCTESLNTRTRYPKPHTPTPPQGDEDEGDSDDEELPFEASASKGGTCSSSSSSSSTAPPPSPRIAPIILAVRSSMRSASQNGAKMSGNRAEYLFRRLSCSLERARSTQRQLRPMWRRDELPAANAKGKPVAFMGRLDRSLALSGLRAAELRQTCWGGCFLGRALPPLLPSRTPLRPLCFFCFIHNLPDARTFYPFRPRERGLGRCCS
jgi:hypothetical protein